MQAASSRKVSRPRCCTIRAIRIPRGYCARRRRSLAKNLSRFRAPFRRSTRCPPAAPLRRAVRATSPNATPLCRNSFIQAARPKTIARGVFLSSDRGQFAKMASKQQSDLVREQFTRTAQIFGDYAVASRVGEAERLARMVKAALMDRAVDLACGPGTLALRFARHVGWICGLDLTAAILARARNSAAADGLSNISFALGDAQALPFADS